jgi:tripartite-type tricarboxylate transporter receptor subunit TctC
MVSGSIAGVPAGLAVCCARAPSGSAPTVSDFVPGYEASAWLGFCAPRNTPAVVVDRLNREINLAIADPTIKARLIDLCASMLPSSSPADFGKVIIADTEKWARVIRRANIRPE